MAEILNLKKRAMIMKLNTGVTNLIRGILMSHCGRDNNREYIPLNWLMYTHMHGPMEGLPMETVYSERFAQFLHLGLEMSEQ
jgi:hypothetical protein